MYSKKVFNVLVALFALMVFNGCGGGGSSEYSKDTGKVLSSVNEYDYFPSDSFSVSPNQIIHSIQRSYATQADMENDVQTFKNKGGYANGDLVYRDYPQTGIRLVSLMSSIADTMYVNSMDIHIEQTSITRDNGLFEYFFGYNNKKSTLVSTSATKYFSKDLTSEFRQYANLLSNKGYKEVGQGQWAITDHDDAIMYIWQYLPDGKSTSWSVTKTVQ
ncbi:MAG: hypothetical protein LBD84_01015 [Campylobacteraceae bacterium]|jgi:hypothetical protein|nr:hypothetical protein [Campylobacteraceae bacterium]